MKTNNLFRIIEENKSLMAIKEIEFSEFNFKERYDIQEWVESYPSILGEELLIICKENSFFDNTRERPDLIALDKDGNVVVIELKRDDSGTNLEWQAIKYASYLSRFSLNDIINMTEKYYSKKNEEISPESIKQLFQEFIDEDSLNDINKKQRIILVSHRFAKEVTSAVNWLIDKYEIDIKCVQLTPFFDKDKSSYYIQSSTILPVPGIEELLISAAQKQEKNCGTGPVKKDDDITDFFMRLYEKLKDALGSSLPDKKSRWAGVGDNYRYFNLWYLNKEIWDNWGLSYRIWLYRNHNEYKSNIVIRLEGNYKYLLSKGLTEGSLESIKNNMKKLNDSGYKYYEKNVCFGIEKVITNDENNIINEFKKLVLATKILIDSEIE
jgi:hypothetical protein